MHSDKEQHKSVVPAAKKLNGNSSSPTCQPGYFSVQMISKLKQMKTISDKK